MVEQATVVTIMESLPWKASEKSSPPATLSKKKLESLLLKRLLRLCLNSSSDRELIIPEAAHSILREFLLTPKSVPSRLMVLVLSIESIS